MRRPRPPRTCTRGAPRSRSPPLARRPSAVALRWRSWTGSAAASTTCPVSRQRSCRWSRRLCRPTRLPAEPPRVPRRPAIRTCEARPPADQLTMPLALANPRHDDDATDVIATDQHAVPDGALTVAQTFGGRPDRHAPGGRPSDDAPHLGPAAAGAVQPAAARVCPSPHPRPRGARRRTGQRASSEVCCSRASRWSSVSASRSRRTSPWWRSARRSCAPTRGPRRRPRTGCGAAAAVVHGPLAAITSPWYLLVATGGTPRADALVGGARVPRRARPPAVPAARRGQPHRHGWRARSPCGGARPRGGSVFLPAR